MSTSPMVIIFFMRIFRFLYSLKIKYHPWTSLLVKNCSKILISLWHTQSFFFFLSLAGFSPLRKNTLLFIHDQSSTLICLLIHRDLSRTKKHAVNKLKILCIIGCRLFFYVHAFVHREKQNLEFH